MNYLQFDFNIENERQKEKLIALLSEAGFEGFEELEQSLIAFIPEQNFNQDEFSGIMNMFTGAAYIKKIVENINWNKKWEDGFNPVFIDDFVVIRAAFHQPVGGFDHEIVITPKMSFGTGHHATTCLLIKQMRELNFAGKSVLDFGTGTGILAILAEKLGAQQIVAIDYDEWSIANATENVEQNGCTRIFVQQTDSVHGTEKFDIILANINLNVILCNLQSIVTSSFTGASIVLSGFLKENETVLINAVEKVGLKFLLTLQYDDWIAVMVKKP